MSNPNIPSNWAEQSKIIAERLGNGDVSYREIEPDTYRHVLAKVQHTLVDGLEGPPGDTNARELRVIYDLVTALLRREDDRR